jgi:hypothetical protein
VRAMQTRYAETFVMSATYQRHCSVCAAGVPTLKATATTTTAARTIQVATAA